MKAEPTGSDEMPSLSVKHYSTENSDPYYLCFDLPSLWIFFIMRGKMSVSLCPDQVAVDGDSFIPRYL